MRLFAQALPEYKDVEGMEEFADKFGEATIGDIFSVLLPYIYSLAGLILFIYLIIGGFEFLTSGGNKDKIQSAQSKLTNAVVGFVIIFLSYWLVKIIEIIFGLQIL